MSLVEIREGWNEAARTDAMFNILTVPDRDNGRWDADEFFATGDAEIEGALDYLRDLGLLPPGWYRALDFGCGVGRLTLALADSFDYVVGVDISSRMVGLARQYAKERGYSNCRFRTSSRTHLRWLGNDLYDLVYSVITLQHLPPDLQRGYIQEFVRVLAPGGRAVFQVTEGESMENGHLSMYGVLPGQVFDWVHETGGEVLHSEPSTHTGDEFSGRMYVVKR